MFKKIFRGSEKNKENHSTISEIGLPTNVVRGIHVSKNKETGDLEGLPKQWTRMLQNLITEDERSENPDAAYQAVKFYNYSIKKNLNAEPAFKPFVTDEAIAEEDAEIEDFLIAKQAHNSEDSFGDDKRSSEEDNNKVADEDEPPALPPPLPKKSRHSPTKATARKEAPKFVNWTLDKSTTQQALRGFK